MRRAKGVFAELVADCDTGCTELQTWALRGELIKKDDGKKAVVLFYAKID